jgi:hypothetical protein
MMKRIIDGRTYNTRTARELCRFPCGAYHGDFGWHITKLYRTAKGAYFLAGCGEAASRWAQPALGGGTGSGSGIEVITAYEARTHLEEADEIDILEELFAIEEA